MRLKSMLATLAALTMLAVLVGCNSLVQSGGDQGQQAPPEQKAPDKQEASERKKEKNRPDGEQEPAVQAPEDETLGLSIPKLGKQFDNIPTGRGDDTELLRNNAAVHIEYPTVSGDIASGFPWEEGANVYLAGHVEGYEGTPSYKAFAGLKTLENGDEIIVTDANGTRYNYEVYEKRVVKPTEVEVLEPVPGKSIVTLQTCELVNFDENGNPDYSNTERLIVRGGLQS